MWKLSGDNHYEINDNALCEEANIRILIRYFMYENVCCKHNMLSYLWMSQYNFVFSSRA